MVPKGPKGEKRPADVIGAAVIVGKIATGEVVEEKPSAAAELGRKGGLKRGKARANKLSPKQRSAAAQAAAKARWSKP
jgi:hypothetical protein